MLLARLAGGFQAPLAKAAGLFQAFTRNFAYGVKAYIDQRVAGGEALAEPRGPRRPRRRGRGGGRGRSEARGRADAEAEAEAGRGRGAPRPSGEAAAEAPAVAETEASE